MKALGYLLVVVTFVFLLPSIALSCIAYVLVLAADLLSLNFSKTKSDMLHGIDWQVPNIPNTFLSKVFMKTYTILVLITLIYLLTRLFTGQF